MHSQLSPGRMYNSDVKTKLWAYWETVHTNISWPFKANCSHIWMMYQRRHCGISQYFYRLQALGPCHFPSIDLEPREWWREKESWITTESKADVSSGHSNSSGQSCLWGRTSGQEVPKRKPLAYPEASWSLKVREAHPRRTFYCSVLF